MRSGTDVRHGSQSTFQFIPKVFNGVEVRALCRPEVLSHRSQQTICVWTSIYAQGHCHAEKGKGLPRTVATKLEAHSSRMSLYTVALRVPFIGTKGPSSNNKASPDHYSSFQTLVGTMHWGRWFSWQPLNPDLSIGLPGGEEHSLE